VGPAGHHHPRAHLQPADGAGRPRAGGPGARAAEVADGLSRSLGDRIELRGLRAQGVHGVLPEEQVRAQPFEVDLTVEADLRAAGRSDDLADTLDYGAITES